APPTRRCAALAPLPGAENADLGARGGGGPTPDRGDVRLRARPVTASRPLFPLPFPPDDNGPIPAYFDSFAPPGPSTEKLDGDRQADVVVVGGGYTGLSTAVHLAERGARPIVLEARDIGWGESSRSFGQVVPDLRHPPAHLAHQLGAEVAERLVDATGCGPDLVFSRSEEHTSE